MADGYIELPPDRTGKKADTAQLETGNTAGYRLRLDLPSGINVRGGLIEAFILETRVKNFLLTNMLPSEYTGAR
jgi:hypothetical protein